MRAQQLADWALFAGVGIPHPLSAERLQLLPVGTSGLRSSRPTATLPDSYNTIQGKTKFSCLLEDHAASGIRRL
jgi:hypothetical protein